MTKILLLTGTSAAAADILPSLGLLDHSVRVGPASAAAARDAGHQGVLAPAHGRAAGGPVARQFEPDLLLVDARRDLMLARRLCGELSQTGIPVIVIVTEGGWAAITADWGSADVVLDTAGPGEVEARIRLATARPASAAPTEAAAEVRSGGLVIDETTYSARIGGRALDLTFKEFELLKFLAQHPRRVFSRSQLLQEVWGYDYFGGTRTVDVHVRRLRAKLGAENEALIGTVRNVGYKFVPAKARQRADAGPIDDDDLGPDESEAAAGPVKPDGAGQRGNGTASGNDRLPTQSAVHGT